MKRESSVGNSVIQKIFILCVILFWGVPFIQDLLPKKDAQEIINTCIQFVNPIVCIILSYLYCRENKFHWFLPLGFMLIYAPLPFLFYETSTLIFMPIYGGCACLGYGISVLINRVKKQTQYQ